MERWEHSVVYISLGREMEHILFDYGNNGWQLVAATLDSDNHMYTLFFKRQLQ